MTTRLRIVFFADTHLGYDFPIHPRIERRRRGPDFFDNYHRVLRYAKETSPDLVVHGGDLFFRSRVPSNIIDMAYEPLLELARGGASLLIVPGNHERSILPTSLYLSHPNIHVFAKPMTYELVFHGVKIAASGFPFERGDIRSRFPSVLRKTGWDDTDTDLRLLCFHHPVEGSRVAHFTFRTGRDVIRLAGLPRDAHAVLSGHIHRRQVLRCPAGERVVPVIYPGSTERTSFAERDEEKGFYDLAFDRDVNGTWGLSRIEFVALPARPMVDLFIEPGVGAHRLEEFLRKRVTRFDTDAVVRIRCRDALPDDVIAKLTGAFCRCVFPDTMNVQFGSEVFPRPKPRRTP